MSGTYSYQEPTPSPRLDTTGGLDSQLSRDRDPTSDYRRAQAQASMISAGGSPGIGIGGAVDAGFDTTGELPDNSNVQSTTTTGGTDELVRRSAGGDEQLDSGLSGGRAIG